MAAVDGTNRPLSKDCPEGYAPTGPGRRWARALRELFPEQPHFEEGPNYGGDNARHYLHRGIDRGDLGCPFTLRIALRASTHG
jgi:hypothetical protein